MTTPRFLQIHTLHSYTAALLNRDDSGQAKRLVYGGTSRTRISSQCLKRHWRTAENDPHALQRLAGYVDSFRSRELVTEKVIAPLKGRYSDEVVAALEPAFQKLVYGDKADKGKKSRQTLLLGQPELSRESRCRLDQGQEFQGNGRKHGPTRRPYRSTIRAHGDLRPRGQYRGPGARSACLYRACNGSRG